MLQVLGAVVESSELHIESFHIELILSISACWRGEQSPWSFTDSPQGSKTKLPLVRRLPALTSGKAAGGVEGLCWSSCPVLRRAKSQGLDTGVKRARWAKQRLPSSQGPPHYLLTYLPMGCWGGANEQCRLLCELLCCDAAVPQQWREREGLVTTACSYTLQLWPRDWTKTCATKVLLCSSLHSLYII